MAPKHAEQVPEQRIAPARPLSTGAALALCALFAWVVVGLAVGESTRWSTPAGVASALGVGLLAGLLVAVALRATAVGPLRSRREVLGRGAVAVAVGAVVGEFAALVLFAGPIDRRLEEQAARRAEAAPAVLQASADLNRVRGVRSALDDAVTQARRHRDEALIVARCEYHPSPACPQTRITGVPGAGPETRTADDELADTQRELDGAVAARDRRAPGLDAQVANAETALGQARRQSAADRDGGLGARWVALQQLTVASPAALLLRLITTAFCVLLHLLPLFLRLWRRETAQDRRAAADAERERAELQADTAIAVKRAEVRAAAEALWAEHQLAAARLAVEAQTEIERAHHHRRVAEALVESNAQPVLHPVQPVESVQPPRFADVDIYLPIAAEAEAASRAALLPAPAAEPQTDNLPAPADPDSEAQAVVPDTGTGPVIPNVTRAAARWIRPLVPTFVARAIDTTTQPLRAARQVFEEVEDITFSLRRTRKVTVDCEETLRPPRPGETATGPQRETEEASFIASSDAGHAPSRPIGAGMPRPTAHSVAGGEPRPAVGERDRPGELEGAQGPRQLPPGQ